MTTTTETPTMQVSTRELLAIADKLQEQTARMFSQPPWRDKLLAALVATDKHHGMLRAGQIFRDYPDYYDADKAVFLIMWNARLLAWRRHETDAELLRLRAAIATAEKAAGVGPDDEWDDVPPEVDALYGAIEHRELEVEAEVLREYGETELAELRLNDDDAYRAKWEPGRIRTWGSDAETETAKRSLAADGNDCPGFFEVVEEVERLRGLVSSQGVTE